MDPRPSTPHGEVWISFGDAARTIMTRRRIELGVALSVLREACHYDKVLWRHNLPLLDERGKVRISGQRPDMLTFWCETKQETIHAFEEQVEIRESDLSRWPVKPRRGPERGKIARFADDDRALFGPMRRMIERESKSPTEAARQLVWEKKVKGIGSPESRARRLANLYRKEHLQRPR
jgi:hypothetical protein